MLLGAACCCHKGKILWRQRCSTLKQMIVDMSNFVSQLSPVTGKMEWKMQKDNYDYYQEVARSAYADMLHDTERNKKYDVALTKAIKSVKLSGKKAKVLDIGTGTGLLSMMAVRAGADSVVACEAFAPMAKCAAQVISDNQMTDKIVLIGKRSTELKIGLDDDMPEKANILVTEVFDTELIGEGGLHTFKHAHENLLEPLRLPDGVQLDPPDEIANCAGSAGVLDLQLEQFPRDRFQPITDPFRAFQFDFTGRGKLTLEGHSIVKRSVKRAGVTHAIFMWWDLRMDMDGDVILSCAPSWAHPDITQQQWRDHWMQATYFPRSIVNVSDKDSIIVDSYHDDYSLWFDVRLAAKSRCVRVAAPACTGGAHVAYSPSRLGMINDVERLHRYIDVLQRQSGVCKLHEMTIVSVSDGSILPLILAKMGAKKIYSIETHPNCRRVVERFAAHNKVLDRISFITSHASEDLIDEKVDLIVAEPFFNTSALPWHNVFFWYARTALNAQLRSDAPWRVMPRGASLRAIAVDFDDLWKIRAPVGVCEGFDLSTFDSIIDEASRLVDATVEPQPLWEYPGKPLSDVIPMMDMDFTKPLKGVKKIERNGVVSIKRPGRCNGIALWMDYMLDDITQLTSGLVAPPTAGQNLQWDMHTRQGVHILPLPVPVQIGSKLKYKLIFTPSNGDFDFQFSVLT